MLFAHLKRILKLDSRRLRGPNGASDEFLLAATAQNLRKLAKLIPLPMQPVPACGTTPSFAPIKPRAQVAAIIDFFNTIDPKAAVERNWG